jgi:hypothetical protein
MLVALAGNALNVDAGRRAVAVPQSLLHLVERARLVGDHPPEGGAQLVDVNLLDPGLGGVLLQVVREGMRGQGRSRASTAHTASALPRLTFPGRRPFLDRQASPSCGL